MSFAANGQYSTRLKTRTSILFAAALTGTPAMLRGEGRVLVPWDHQWTYLLPSDEVDPAIADPDFDDTWFLKSGNGPGDFEAVYNGHPFGRMTGSSDYDAGTGRGPLGDGMIDYFLEPGAAFTSFGTPLPRRWNATYFRTTFLVPPGGLIQPVLRALFDDGAYVYLDGILVARVNINPVWAGSSGTAIGNLIHWTKANRFADERVLQTIDLSVRDDDDDDAWSITVPNPVTGVLPEGMHTLAITNRSWSLESSDYCMAAELSMAWPLIAQSSNVLRQSHGTVEPADDTFTYEIALSNAGTRPAGWSATLPAGTTGPAAGRCPEIARYSSPIARSVAIGFRDRFDLECSTSVTVIAPPLPAGLSTVAPRALVRFEAPPPGTSSFTRDFDDDISDLSWTAGASGAAATRVVAGFVPPNQFLQGSGAPWNRFETEPVDIRTASELKASFKLAAYTTASTPFEVEDTVQAFVETSFDGTTWSALHPPILDSTDGAALFDEIKVTWAGNLTGTGYALPPGIAFTVSKSAAYQTGAAHYARVVITGGGDSVSEFLLIDDIEITMPRCGINVEVGNATRAPNGQGVADDTFTFSVRATNDLGDVLTGFDTDAPGLAHGHYGVSYVAGPFPATGPAVVTFTDSGIPGCRSQIRVDPPHLLELGRLIIGPSITTIYTDPASETPAAWRAGPQPFSVVQNNGGGNSLHELASETVDLSAISGPVHFTARLVAFESDDGSNFESDDIVRIRLELNGPGVPPSVPLVTRVMDGGSGTPNGYLNGYTGLSEADYLTNIPRDEFNASAAGWRGSSGKTFDFFYRIPDSATSARVVIPALNNSATEFFTVSDIVFTTGPVGLTDSDGDGQSDLSEALAGTNPNDPNDTFRLTGITRHAGGLQATFRSRAGVNYHAEHSAALENGWFPAGAQLPGTGANITVNVPPIPAPAGTEHFLRVRVVP